jgi:hypothetical protein
MDRVGRECLKCERSNKFLSGTGHDDMDIGSGLGQQSQQFNSLIGGDASGHPEEDLFILEHMARFLALQYTGLIGFELRNS